MSTYLVIGVYADGVTRTHHVTTARIADYAARLTTGFLPFERVSYVRCAHGLGDCDCAVWL